jgi:hypothetical protein
MQQKTLQWTLLLIFLQIKWKKQDVPNTKSAQHMLRQKLQWNLKWLYPIYAALHKMYGSGLKFNFMGNVGGFVRYFTWMHACIKHIHCSPPHPPKKTFLTLFWNT